MSIESVERVDVIINRLTQDLDEEWARRLKAEMQRDAALTALRGVEAILSEMIASEERCELAYEYVREYLAQIDKIGEGIGRPRS